MATRTAEVQRRIVSKDGHNNVRVDNVEGMVKLYLHDIWTTVVDMKWRYKLTLFASTFVMTWFIFGVIFYFIGMGNGDFDPDLSANRTACVVNVKTLTGAFLFSLESQTTIGYGLRYISEECPLAIFTLVASSSSPAWLRSSSPGPFSPNWPAQRKERRPSSSSNVTEEGEKTQIHQSSVDFFMDSSGECPFLILPLTFYHVLDEHSPLTGLNAENLQTRDFELLVTLNATMESTAATCQSRTSYVPQEILWGYEFKPVLFSTTGGRYVADFNFFDKVQVTNDAVFLSNNTEKLKLEEDYKKE
ncbi:ATP-sensitive inward rectifier potassium channel 15 [Dissostichus eleginoides]|uniref:ATP-sensitive inward rectifier potassium channel 15 n=1 Tax=Dissostichus eleginoides TaxID=100907 RepID=A0AAD9BHS1_DISEL|nr:ATP-sensitive inward rectifier potassium channel 15 [Dissostichus eleginoides]